VQRSRHLAVVQGAAIKGVGQFGLGRGEGGRTMPGTGKQLGRLLRRRLVGERQVGDQAATRIGFAVEAGALDPPVDAGATAEQVVDAFRDGPAVTGPGIAPPLEVGVDDLIGRTGAAADLVEQLDSGLDARTGCHVPNTVSNRISNGSRGLPSGRP